MEQIHCRSELAREEPEGAALNQDASVIVDGLREQFKSEPFA
jgi:thymidine kinase